MKIFLIDCLTNRRKFLLKEHRNHKEPSLRGTLNLCRSKNIAHLDRLRAIKRIDYILHFDEEEYKIVQRYYPTKAKYHFFSYATGFNLEISG